MVGGCGSARQNARGKTGVKKGTGARAGPEAGQPLVGKLFSTGRSNRERPLWFCFFYGKVFILTIGVVLGKEEYMFRKVVA